MAGGLGMLYSRELKNGCAWVTVRLTDGLALEE
jgi:hypothetical protein